jgi:hypothetical protein
LKIFTISFTPIPFFLAKTINLLTSGVTWCITSPQVNGTVLARKNVTDVGLLYKIANLFYIDDFLHQNSFLGENGFESVEKKQNRKLFKHKYLFMYTFV